jgi:hypothetical protein
MAGRSSATRHIAARTCESFRSPELAGHAVRGQDRFERIYLLNALDPGLQAFDIFSALAECR